jgi:hypothetical protein
MSNYFVKFVPYNENTLSSLINKTIKFSTVYEFNDFNELGFLGTQSVPYGEDFNKKLEQIINMKLKYIEARETLYRNALESGQYRMNILDQFKSRISDYTTNNPNVFDKAMDYLLIEETLAFSSVGIFSVSSLDVFCDDSAQLMFAHYGDNLKGLALIYEISEDHKPLPIEYPDCENEKKLSDNECFAKLKPASGGNSGRIFKWVNSDYSDISDFLKKSIKWKYEQESRLFAKPGQAKADNHGIKLKAILSTSRFLNNIETLRLINKYIYHNTLTILAIGPSCSHYKFVIYEDDSRSDLGGRCVSEVILEKLENPATQ